MSKRRELVLTSAASEGPEWSAWATAWAELWGGLAMPAFQARRWGPIGRLCGTARR
jgi:hypothetical protein